MWSTPCDRVTAQGATELEYKRWSSPHARVTAQGDTDVEYKRWSTPCARVTASTWSPRGGVHTLEYSL